MIRGREEGAEMMIEPPGNFRRGRIFEIDNGVFVAGKVAFLKKGPGAMDEAVVFVLVVLPYALAMEAGEERSRAGSIKALVVIQDANLQCATLPWRSVRNLKQETTSIAGSEREVKRAGETNRVRQWA